MKWLLEKKIVAGGLGLAMLILSIVSLVSYQNMNRLFERQKKVEYTYQVLQEVRDVLTTVRDAERARRGYIITGKELYLDTYKTSIENINPKFQELRRSTADNPKHQQRLDILEPLIAERVALIEKSVELYKKNKSNTAAQISLTDKGLMLHDAIWKEIAQMESEERSLLQRRATESEESFRETILMDITGSCLSFALLFAVYWLLIRQITKRENVEHNLRESELRYRNLFEVNPHPLWVYDLETLAFIAVNDLAINHYGYSQAEFLAMTMKDIRPLEDVSAFLNIISTLPPGVKRVAIERHLKRDGTIINAEITSHELIFGGRRARLVLACDITEEKQAQDALRTSEEKFRQIAENIHEIFWMSDADLKEVLYVNPVYENIWGRSCESLYANPQSFLEVIHPEDRERVTVNLEKNAKTEFEIEYRIVKPDGLIRWICDRAFPIKNAAGEVYRRAGVTEDVTERKQAEEIRRTLEKERELSELKLRFFSMASHEFRTPLSTILISAQLLENCTKEWPKEKTLKNIYRIQGAAKTMTQLLTDILTLTRAEAGKLEFNPEPLNLERFCQHIVEEIELSDRTKSRITFTSKNRCEQAYLDEKLLRSIVTNLLANAIKYSPSNCNIYFILSCEARKAILQVQDQGIGIPLEDRPKLYQAFQRGTNVGDVVGTGLGLAVVKKCVDLHGGSINVESEVGVGSTFTVTIPWAGECESYDL